MRRAFVLVSGVAGFVQNPALLRHRSPIRRQLAPMRIRRLTDRAANPNVKDKRCSCFARRKLHVTIALHDGRAAMRWYVSIGAVLVAGALAGGDVAGIAAPRPQDAMAGQYSPRPGRQ